ncbi:DUF805 domain-containing protein [Caulobacter sp.]|uniref:DUF805 domain-containing protein n=1 Tax=Caulobacter sp. TaxID=78 RepID=UPI001B1E43C9|nr:DUF805 domain-containing protein [Caulobacter sp.]MBO9545078.1 DUF805 domain-containing protein [Caulobacter sp.]
MFFYSMRHFADFHGRSRREEFWPFAIFAWATRWIGLVAFFGGFGMLSYAGNMGDETAIPAGGAMIVGGGVYMLWVSIALMSVTARRLHDIGMTGWLTLLHFAPLVDLALYGLALVPGSTGPNRYGDDPKAPATFAY